MDILIQFLQLVWTIGVGISVVLVMTDVISSLDEDRDIARANRWMKIAMCSFLAGAGAKAVKALMHIIGL